MDHTCDENAVIMESTPCVFDDCDGGEENPCILIVMMKALYDRGDEMDDCYFPPQNILGAYSCFVVASPKLTQRLRVPPK